MQLDFSTLDRLTAQHGCPLYIYDRDVILQQAQHLREIFPSFTLLYSMKANPHPKLVRLLHDQGFGLDAASKNEVHKALEAGFAAKDIFYSAPGKTDADIAASSQYSTIIADSYAELRRIDALCKEQGRHRAVGLRLSPNFSYSAGTSPQTGGGLPDKFGEAEESLALHADFLQSLTHAQLVGFHVYVRSQVLSAEALLKYFSHVLALADMWKNTLGLTLSFINLGGGLGVPYAHGAPDLQRDTLRAGIRTLQARFAERCGSKVRLCIESGRYLVAESGVFVTRIEDIKESRGKIFVIVSGLLNGFMRPSISGLMAHLPQAGGLKGPMEPLWSGHNSYKPIACGRSVPAQRITICGNLCTSFDSACRDVVLEDIAVGNFLIFTNAGAYGASLSPSFFSSHDKAAEIIL